MRIHKQARSLARAAGMLALLAAFYAAAWLALSWGWPTPAQAAGNGTTEQYVLPNGLKVLIREDHSFPVVATLAWYRVGSRNETIGSTGITHLVEHLLFGTVGSFRKGEIGALVARNGGQFNAFTSDDFTTFFEVLPPGKLELALRIESERMSAALFSQKEVQEEIARVQEELEEGEKDFVDTLAREVRAAAYQQHPYHNPTTGWRTDLENITAQQVQAYYKQFFRPDNATLVIVGDVKSNLALALVRKYFEPVAKGQGAVPVVTIVEPSQKGERRVVVKYSGNREVLQVAYHAPAMHDADGPAMYVLEKLLSAHHSGRLRARLMNSRVCSWAQGGFEGKRDPGLFSITCYAAPGSGQEEILEAVDALIAQLRGQPVAEAELKRARNQAEFGYLTEGDGPYRFGFHLGFADSLGEWQKALTWTERVRAVTAADVQRVAKRYFNPDNRVIGWLSTPNAPKPPPKSPPGESQPPREPRSPQRQALGVRLTGYKTDDAAPGPGSGATASTALKASVEPSGAATRQVTGGSPAATTAGGAPEVTRAGQPGAAATTAGQGA
ncbi:MAG TPA: pitrilysin family protein, partial [Candidatus Obscuribacterales bacterium]